MDMQWAVRHVNQTLAVRFRFSSPSFLSFTVLAVFESCSIGQDRVMYYLRRGGGRSKGGGDVDYRRFFCVGGRIGDFNGYWDESGE